ncbi:DUF1285 domain-containing protein [Rhodoblastus sp.]|jgi:hypothetical protein|uniref:DUF1285 domain-containing protein n=1 Tax=Rhodoblastus sp. TaxID=1962975 RepID=UPI00262269F3|nr:DUF1285 domain-containing protein [Rhodoblastus sp.]
MVGKTLMNDPPKTEPSRPEGSRPEPGAPSDPLRGLAEIQRSRGPAPVHLWNPPYCGEIDMRIARDGTWFYNGTPIGRPALVRLFSSVLRKDPERFVLVTPVERVGIVVEDAPFLGVELVREGEGEAQILRLRTNVEEWVDISMENPLKFLPGESGGLKPYVLVRGDLWALVKRALFYDLVAWGESRTADGEDMFGVYSRGAFFAMAPMREIADLS